MERSKLGPSYVLFCYYRLWVREKVAKDRAMCSLLRRHKDLKSLLIKLE